MVSGVADLPFTRQYRNTPAYLYFIEQQVRWGLGWPLGLLAFGGFAWALAQAARRKLSPGGWIVLAWLVPYFGINGLFLAKFMRYMSPVTPLIIVLGAGMLAWLGRRFSRRAALILAGVTLFGAALWAAMFVNGVYGTEHSWVTASRWIYAHVPDGSCIAVEHWEESLPRDWAGLEPGMSPGAHAYRQPQLPMYDPDTEQKYQILRDTLRNCDYLVIASNRMWRTLPRLSTRYPMSTRYYEALFGGELGYEKVAEFATPPRLGPLVIDDQAADESFTVYDHPRAFIFQKVRDLSDAEWFAVLGDTWRGAVHGYVGRPTLLMRLRGHADVPLPRGERAGDEKTSTRLRKPLSQWPVVDDWRWNALANRNPAAAIVVWWLAAQVIGLATFPLAARLLRRLADGGWLMSKSLGLLLVSYGVWLPAGLGLPANRRGVAMGVLLLLALCGAWLARRSWPALRDLFRRRWPFIVTGEAVFAAVFLLFVGYRLANPDLWQPWNGGEKMLEIGFLHAIVKSAYMPPYDPFFAGTFINYYYYGLFIVGVLVKLTGITPTVAFNLAVPLLAALTAVNVFSLGSSLSRLGGSGERRRLIGGGLLATLIVVFFSNLDGMGQFLRDLAGISRSSFQSVLPGLQTLVRGVIGFWRAMGGTPIPEYNFWDPSRVIPNTINEFPYWSFLFADLHPHMIGIPFTVLFLGLLYAGLKRFSICHLSPLGLPLPLGEGGAQKREWAALAGRGLAMAFVLGALAIINTWDLPTYLGLMMAAFAVARYRRDPRPPTLRRWGRLMAETAGFGGLAAAATMLLYRPFFAHYQALDVGLGLVRDKIPLDQFFKLWGFFLLVIFTWLWLEARRPRTRFAPLRAVSLFVRRWNILPHLLDVYRALVTRAEGGYTNALASLGLLLLASLALASLRFYTLALLLPWLGLALLLLLRRETSAEQVFVELLVFTGLLLLVGVQIVFLRDFLGGGDYYRMNTYFKFFIQVWVLFGLAAAATLPLLWRRTARWGWGGQLAWQGAVAALVFSSLVFIPLGTRTRLDNRFPGPRPPRNTLDGMAYMTVGEFQWDNVTYDLRYDYEAIRWLQEHVAGTPVIAEAKVGYYREWGMRVAAYTGLPSILGGLHQSEQHFPPELGKRDGQVNRFWLDPDEAQTETLIRELGIEYIYVGQLEQAIYGAGALAKFESLATRGVLEVAFQNERTVIYRVVNSEL